jgi:archaellum component FlaC
MAEPMATVTVEEFEAQRAESRRATDRLTEDVERLGIRLEVVSHDTARLTHDLADLRDDVSEFREDFERFRSEVNGRFERLEKTVVDGNAALMAAILQLGRAR